MLRLAAPWLNAVMFAHIPAGLVVHDALASSSPMWVIVQCFPMAFLVEQAGGLATTGTERILDIMPQQIHERYGTRVMHPYLLW